MRIFIAILITVATLFHIGCQFEAASDDNGEALSKTYCGTCHQYPSPNTLDKSSWEKYILPRMGYMMGIYDNATLRATLIEEGEGGKLVEAANIYPTEPTINLKDWERVKKYYLDNAPEQLKTPVSTIQVGLEQFKVRKPTFKLSPPSSTMVRFTEDHNIYVGDAQSQKLLLFDNNREFVMAGNINQGAVDIQDINNELWITVMGSFSPTDAPTGFVLNMPKGETQRALIAMDNLRRPVHTAYGDLNGDGLMDAVVSEFGRWTGRLSLFINQGNASFQQRTLINQPGAIRSYLRDFNQDGLMDVIALFGQGNEGIYIFYNEGGGNFKTERVLQFSPSNGSSFFDLMDVNADGHLDIIYTAGDNADFQPVMKPYHGIYIFENDGNNQFKQTFFYHLNGAYNAKLADFDLDGDVDIAAISFFPDYQNNAQESFVYLQNDGSFNFSATTFADNTMGRWIVMDADDMDEDGDLDLVLGSLAFEVIPDNGLVQRWVQDGLPFVVLENTTR